MGNCGDEDCTLGQHIHTGTSCDTTESQGGHQMDSAGVDPWAGVGAPSTTDNRPTDGASFKWSPSPISLVSADDATYPDINGLAFVVHDHIIADDGSTSSPRVGCGILSMVAQTEDSADLSPIDGSNSGISGSVRIFKGSVGMLVFGSVTGFDGDISVPQQNGAGGAHVHSGSGCADNAAQGGHYWESDGTGALPLATDFDPYGTNAFIGAALNDGDYTLSADESYDFVYAILVGTDYVDVTGNAFVVHDLTGARAACGVLSSAPVAYEATISEFGNSGVSGNVVIYRHGDELYLMSALEGLSNNCGDASCTLGQHIHTGTSCDTVDSQGGHQMDSAGVDPWAGVGAPSTTDNRPTDGASFKWTPSPISLVSDDDATYPD